MNFLFPGFLFALSAVAIPVLIHLYNFRRFKKVYFTNVRLLKTVEQQNSSRRNLRNRLILAARILAIIFIVLAFAKPYIVNKNTRTAQNALVSIYIDNSYSMETINRDGSLLDEAKRRALEIVNSYNLNDKFQLLTSDFEGKHQRILNRNEFLKALESIKAGGAMRTIPEVIQRQKDIYLKEPNAAKFSYIVSDFQSNVISNSFYSEQDSSLNVRLVKLTATNVPNISVDSAWFISPIHRIGNTERLVVRLKNSGTKQAKNVPLKLLVNKVQKSVAAITVEKESFATDTLEFSGLNAGWQQVQLSIKDYPVIFDDEFFLSFNVLNELSILIINGTAENRYLNALFNSDRFFNIKNVSAGNINYSSLPAYSYIILNEISDYSSGFNQQIKSFVQNGGSVFIFPSVDGNLPAFTNFLRSLGTDIPKEIISSTNKVSKLNLRHPFFNDVFVSIPRNLDLPVANKYINYTSTSKALKLTILDFAGGKTFIAEYKMGKGRVYLSAVPAAVEASNLVRHSVFIPIMYQSALSGLRFRDLYYTLGKNQTVETTKFFLNADQKLILKGAGFEIIPDIRQTENNTNLFIGDQVKVPGNYSLYKADSLIADFSFNDSKSESELTFASNSEIKSKIKGKNVKFFEPKRRSLQTQIKDADSGIQLWKVCLVLSLVFLGAEILLLRFLKSKRLKTANV